MDILIVDDAESVRLNISRLISGALPEITISTASDCRSAIELLKSKEFQLVVLDIKLPDGSGFDVLTTINEMGLQTKVVMVSNFVCDKFKAKAMELGAAKFFDKTGEIDGL
ncbi:MAG: hypothetical protein B6D45_07870, partial [Ignavibacteriales bacterium UTCHB3]